MMSNLAESSHFGAPTISPKKLRFHASSIATLSGKPGKLTRPPGRNPNLPPSGGRAPGMVGLISATSNSAGGRAGNFASMSGGLSVGVRFT